MFKQERKGKKGIICIIWTLSYILYKERKESDTGKEKRARQRDYKRPNPF